MFGCGLGILSSLFFVVLEVLAVVVAAAVDVFAAAVVAVNAVLSVMSWC